MSNPFHESTPRYNLHEKWNDTSKEAYLYERLPNNKVQCLVCPRRCKIAPHHVGTCKVRKNLGGRLFAQSYGKATHVTIEQIETEAVHHYLPGSKILALGNFGCNLNCDYCQNWKYSQFEYTAPDQVKEYTATQIIELALREGVPMLSWTYNDPAVWYEFVLDTARTAREYGLKNLFKSAFFLTTEAVQELCRVIDVFAISIKAIDEAYYTKFTKGWLQPVLENARRVHRSGIHYEVSNLVVTGLTNTVENYDKMIDFVLDELSPDTPLHFTRFHPDYKYMHHPKTPLEDVMAAYTRAKSRGLRYPYVGNTFQSPGLNTYCPRCGELLIERYGLTTYVKPTLAVDGKCRRCDYQTTVRMLAPPVPVRPLAFARELR